MSAALAAAAEPHRSSVRPSRRRRSTAGSCEDETSLSGDASSDDSLDYSPVLSQPGDSSDVEDAPAAASAPSGGSGSSVRH
eukprot:6174751-Pleurochrysis_carterae.AAC.2